MLARSWAWCMWHRWGGSQDALNVGVGPLAVGRRVGVGELVVRIAVARMVCRLLLLVVTIGVGSIFLAGGAQASGPFSWGVPVAVDHALPYGRPRNFGAVSCPSAGLCVAADDAGNVVTSTDPTARTPAWEVAHIDARGAIRSVSCPSVSLCVGVDGAGDVATSTDPGAGRWQIVNVDGSNAMTGISCATNALCVAVDGAGDAVVSTDPIGGHDAWRVEQVDFNRPITGVSCPSSSLCVAIDSEGDAVTTTNPGDGSAVWTVAHVDMGQVVCGGPAGGRPCPAGLTSISCPTSSVCVAVDDAGSVLSSTDPAGGPSAWASAPIGFGVFPASMACPSVSLCVGVDSEGTTVTSSHPTDGQSAWSRHISTNPLSAISCPTVASCVAVHTDRVFTTTSPLSGAWSQPMELDDGSNDLGAISCVKGMCVAIDNSGHVVTSSDPTSGSAGWASAEVDPPTYADGGLGSTLANVSCATRSLCVATDLAGGVLTSTAPTAGPGAWASGRTSARFGAVSCPSLVLCAAAGGNSVLTSTRPAGGASSWIASPIPIAGDLVENVSCPTTSQCVATTYHGHIVSSTKPTGGTAFWHVVPFTDTSPLFPLSCPSAQLCVSADFGSVLTSTDPASRHASWTATPLPPVVRGSVVGMYCPSVSLCVGFFSQTPADDMMLVSTNPTGGRSAWTLVSTPLGLNAMSCAPTTRCIAVGGSFVVPLSILARPTPTPNHIKAALLKALTTRAIRQAVSALRRHNRYVLRIKTPSAGRVVIRCYASSTTARHPHSSSKAKLVAEGTTTVAIASTAAVALKLRSKAARNLLHSRQLAITATVTFAPIGRAPIVATKRVIFHGSTTP